MARKKQKIDKNDYSYAPKVAYVQTGHIVYQKQEGEAKTFYLCDGAGNVLAQSNNPLDFDKVEYGK